MSVRIIVRTAGAGTMWELENWEFLVGLAALSAEPETMAEFFDAVRRYSPSHGWEESGLAVADVHESTGGDGNWCLIDLPSRSVVAGLECELPLRHSVLQATDGEQGDGFPIVWIDTPRKWLFQTAPVGWTSLIADRARMFERRRRVESRSVLFGRPMLEFIARRAATAATAGAVDRVRYDRIRAIHAEWLMTARDDLLEHTPREILLSSQEQIDSDIQHRSEQWSRQGFAPPPLATDTSAYRFGGYGTTEIVLYFDLVRSLLFEAWDSCIYGDSNGNALVQQLAIHRDQYLNQPPEDGGSDHSCNELIESERRRMPVTDDDAHFDCDCPICLAQANGEFGVGPTFMFFDGHHLELEDEFAFSMIESREAWEHAQAEYRCFNEEMERKYHC